MSSDLPATTDDELPEPPKPETQTRVAVEVLQRDQRAILFDGETDRTPPVRPLSQGFASVQEALNWWQAASVRTFGHLADHLQAPDVVADGALRDALLDDDEAAAERRQRHLERTIDACEQAYRQLETHANEWIAEAGESDTDYQHIDVERQRHLAMRPAFSRLDEAQARCLADLWGGFEDRRAVTEWTHRLPAVSAGERGLGSRLGSDRYAMRRLQDPGEDGVRWRVHFAATRLLPAFARRAKRLRGKERARTTGEENPWNEV